MKRISHWIDGRSVVGTSGRTGPVYNPATGEQTADVDLASVSELDAAVAAAHAAFPAWRATSLSGRAEVLFRFRELLDGNRKELASIITAEHGKVHTDALGEVARGIENVEYACGIPQLLKGEFSEQAGDRCGRLFDPATARRRRRHHPVQLPRDGSAVDAVERDRHR